jgi:hypothetical protein
MTFFRARFGGSLPETSEIWRCDLVLQSTVNNLASVAASVNAGLTLAWHGGSGVTSPLEGFYVAGTTLSFLEVDQLTPGTGKNFAQLASAISFPGVATGGPCPPQVAVVVSHRTAKPTRAGRGRIYLPAPAISALNNGELATAAQTAFAVDMAAGYRAMTTGGNVLCVYHRTTDTMDAVVSIDVGQVLDTQRRRRNKLIETRVVEIL